MKLIEEIGRRRRAAAVKIAVDIPVACGAAAGAVLVSGAWRWPLAVVAAWQLACVAASAWEIRNMNCARKLYHGNPVAAYVLEVQRAFGTPAEEEIS